jgi:hypothetical protein
LKSLYGDPLPAGTRIALWDKPSKTSQYLTRPVEANPFENHPDVYVSAALVPDGIGAHARVKAQETLAIPGVWLDIDVNGGPEGKKNAAPDLDAAKALAFAELEPTILVNSGYGLQAWWLFEEPWVFGDEEERRQAQRMTNGWHTRHLNTARRHGYRIDATFDLARLMRLPGTINAKGSMKVPVIELDYDGPRHRPETVMELSLAVAPLAVERPMLTATAQFPQLKFETLKDTNELFKRTWEHTRKDRISEGWTMSEYDLSLASFAIHARWTDDETGALIRMHRDKWEGEDTNKGGRTDYLERTILKARTVMRREEREQLHQRELESLGEMSEAGDTGQTDAVFSKFNTIIGAGLDGSPVIKELVQYNSDPDQARFVFVLDDGVEINVGAYENLREPRRLDKRIAPTTGFIMEHLKDSQEWRMAIRTVMKHRELREDPEDPIVDWVRRYLDESLGGQGADDAAPMGEPFEQDGIVHVRANNLSTYCRTVLRERIGPADLPPLLRKAGFERIGVHHKGKNGKRTTSTYWCIERELLGL